MAKTYSGSTEQVEIPFLTADKWGPGKSVTGVIDEIEESRDFGVSYTLDLHTPIELEAGKEKVSRVRVGNLSGIALAIQAAQEKEGMPELVAGVILTVSCTGVKKSGGKDVANRPNFRIEAVFPDF